MNKETRYPYRVSKPVGELTEKELGVLIMMKEGITSAKEIAKTLGSRQNTVKNQKSSIYLKLGVSNENGRKKGGTPLAIRAINIAIQLGKIKPPKLTPMKTKLEDTPIYQLALKNHPEMVGGKR